MDGAGKQSLSSRKWGVLILGVAGLGFFLLLLLWKIPQYQLAAWKDILEPTDLVHLENEARGILAQIFGLFAQILGGAAILVGLFFTWQTVKATWESLEIAREGQITERFTRAVDQLGNEKLEIRLGGIYALERSAKDSEKDHWPIMEILTAYVREHASWKGENIRPEMEIPVDIQAILTVLGRRTQMYTPRKDQYLDLAETDLQGANFESAHLERVRFTKAHLEKAILSNAHLEKAWLVGMHLEGAYLQGAHLKGARFDGSHLEGTGLKGAAGLTQQQIDSAHGDKDTSLPDGLQRPKHWGS